MTFDAILEAFQAKRVGANFMAKCPAHADRNPSLSISEKDGQILLRCHAGCDTRDVLGAVGLTFEDLHEGPNLHEGPKLVATYDYVDENGEPLFQVCRYEPKTFKQRKADGAGGWSWSLNGVRRVPFLLPDVLRADHVLVVEGEKDAQYASQSMGLTATCNPGGAGKWKDEYSEFLRGKHVTIIPDNDEPGRRHASQVAKSLVGKAASVAICDLPEGIKDLSEWPLSRDSLLDLIKQAPPWSAESEDASLFQSRRDYEDAPPLQFAIDKFLQQDAVNAIAGLSGHGKDLARTEHRVGAIVRAREALDSVQRQRARRARHLPDPRVNDRTVQTPARANGLVQRDLQRPPADAHAVQRSSPLSTGSAPAPRRQERAHHLRHRNPFHAERQR